MDYIAVFVMGMICGCGVTIYVLLDLPGIGRRRGLNKPAEIVKPPALTRYGVGLMGTDEYHNEQRERTARLRAILDKEMREHDGK